MTGTDSADTLRGADGDDQLYGRAGTDALEGLDGVTSAEVTGEPGNFTIALTADEPHVLQWGDLNLDGDGQLDYLIA